MGAAIGAIGIMLLVLGMEWIASIPGAIEKRRKARAEDRFLRWRLCDQYNSIIIKEETQ